MSNMPYKVQLDLYSLLFTIIVIFVMRYAYLKKNKFNLQQPNPCNIIIKYI